MCGYDADDAGDAGGKQRRVTNQKTFEPDVGIKDAGGRGGREGRGGRGGKGREASLKSNLLLAVSSAVNSGATHLGSHTSQLKTHNSQLTTRARH